MGGKENKERGIRKVGVSGMERTNMMVNTLKTDTCRDIIQLGPIIKICPLQKGRKEIRESRIVPV